MIRFRPSSVSTLIDPRRSVLHILANNEATHSHPAKLLRGTTALPAKTAGEIHRTHLVVRRLREHSTGPHRPPRRHDQLGGRTRGRREGAVCCWQHSSRCELRSSRASLRRPVYLLSSRAASKPKHKDRYCPSSKSSFPKSSSRASSERESSMLGRTRLSPRQ